MNKHISEQPIFPGENIISENIVMETGCTPGPHNKNPRHKIFAKGWVAQKHIFYRYLDGRAKIFQGFPRVGSGKTRIL